MASYSFATEQGHKYFTEKHILSFPEKISEIMSYKISNIKWKNIINEEKNIVLSGTYDIILCYAANDKKKHLKYKLTQETKKFGQCITIPVIQNVPDEINYTDFNIDTKPVVAFIKPLQCMSAEIIASSNDTEYEIELIIEAELEAKILYSAYEKTINKMLGNERPLQQFEQMMGYFRPGGNRQLNTPGIKTSTVFYCNGKSFAAQAANSK